MRRIIVIALLALLIAACAPKDEEITIESPFIGGTTGLVLNFQDLRSEVFDGGRDPFDVILMIENRGESNVKAEDLRVKLSGINPAEFSKLEENLILNAPDDVIQKRLAPDGSVIPSTPVFVEFVGLNHHSPIAGSSAQFPLRAEVCYLYRTKAVSKLCVRDNLLTPTPEGICEINEEKPVFNSAAPIQIGNFKESTRAKDKIGFSFEVRNAGNGNIFERNSQCDRSQRKNENRAYVIVRTNLRDLSCTGLESTSQSAEGFITLYGGAKIVSCSQKVSTRSDFEQLVNLEVIYDYEEITQTSLTVKSSGIGLND